MTIAELKSHLMELPSEKRLDLALDLWESLGNDVPVPAWHLEVLEERSKELDRLPEEERATPWEQVRKEIWPDKFE